MKDSIVFGVPYNSKFPWRPKYFFDSCPRCFEVFDFDFKCNHCGSGYDDEDKEET